MIEGTVKWFDVKKGFGFLEGPNGQDVFIHFSSIIGDGFRTLKDGERVIYELQSGDKGDFAKNVERFSKNASTDKVAGDTQNQTIPVNRVSSDHRVRQEHKQLATNTEDGRLTSHVDGVDNQHRRF